MNRSTPFVLTVSLAGSFVLAAPNFLAAQTVVRREAATRSYASAVFLGGYKLGEWSPWTRVEGVEYRFRWGVNPQEPRYMSNVDAVFELRNRRPSVWAGAVRSLDCATSILSMSKRVALQPNETKQVQFLTPNCGTRARPSFRPDIVKSVRTD